jgi:putative peptide-modifying radical SAM enzyme
LLYFVVLTHSCNLRCSYCGYAEDYGESAPAEIEYDVEDLKRFIVKDPDASIIFYGGEPLVRQSLMEQIMDSIPARRYLLQTNALRLKDLESEYLNRFSAILVSIDGRSQTTDRYRGNGVYDKILENLRDIKRRGFTGDLIARMTASEQTDIFLDVIHLLELRHPKFDHVHWQIDALWDSPPELRWNNFEKWITKSYSSGILNLIRAWGNAIIKEKRVPPIVPFNGIMYSVIGDSKIHLRCGAGIDSFSVATNGDLTVCPVAPEWDFAKVGTIFDSRPKDLPKKVTIGEPCTQCETLHLCGGRCLFANKTKLWGETGFRKVCDATKIMINELAKLKPEITAMITSKELTSDAFSYSPYNNGCEIVP